MSDLTTRLPVRAALLTALLALVLGLAACGGSDDDGNGGDSTQASAGPTTEGTDREQIVATFRYLSDAYFSGKAAGYCAKLTAEGQAQVKAAGLALGQRGDCTGIMKYMSRLAVIAKDRPKPVKVISLEIDGDKALFRSTGGIAGRAPTTLRAVKQGGEWKVPDVGLGGLAPQDASQQD